MDQLFRPDRPLGAGDRRRRAESAPPSPQALADAGAAVLVTDLDEDAAAAVAERISDNGGRAEVAALDVCDRDVRRRRRRAGRRHSTDGALHILINNAGVTAPAMFAKLTHETSSDCCSTST